MYLGINEIHLSVSFVIKHTAIVTCFCFTPVSLKESQIDASAAGTQWYLLYLQILNMLFRKYTKLRNKDIVQLETAGLHTNNSSVALKATFFLIVNQWNEIPLTCYWLKLNETVCPPVVFVFSFLSLVTVRMSKFPCKSLNDSSWPEFLFVCGDKACSPLLANN